MSEEPIGYIHSTHLAKAGALSRKGYALYINHSEIAGRQKFTLGYQVAYLAEGLAGLSADTIEKSEKIKQLVYEKPDFRFRRSELQEIELKKGFFGGHIILRSSSGEVKIKIDMEIDDNEFKLLTGMLEAFDSEKLKVR